MSTIKSNQISDEEKKSFLSGKSNNFAFMIGGPTLAVAFENYVLREHLKAIFASASSVVVFRASPLQKAQTVQFIMEDPEAYSMAVGDGGNDVNMIQTATIGVGIMGEEGAQAAQFSDYAVPNFKCVHRLLMLHGRTFGSKMSFLVGLNLYKSINYMIVSYFANLLNGFSGMPAFDMFYWSLYPILNTAFSQVGHQFLD